MMPTPQPTAAESPTELATRALAHFCVGLMQADGAISPAELRQLERLLHRFRHSLPGHLEALQAQLRTLPEAPAMAQLSADEHLEAGLAAFARFHAAGAAVPDHARTIVALLEVLMEEDGVMDAEMGYIARLRGEFARRFAY